jgi:hypothetical protein
VVTEALVLLESLKVYVLTILVGALFYFWVKSIVFVEFFLTVVIVDNCPFLEKMADEQSTIPETE